MTLNGIYFPLPSTSITAIGAYVSMWFPSIPQSSHVWVDEYYHPGTAGQFEVDAPLRKQGGTLTISYGAGGRNPISFQLSRENQALDVGHLKLFFMTKLTDLRHIKQESLFTGTQQYSPYPRLFDTWVALQYLIIQRWAWMDWFHRVTCQVVILVLLSNSEFEFIQEFLNTANHLGDVRTNLYRHNYFWTFN